MDLLNEKGIMDITLENIELINLETFNQVAQANHRKIRGIRGLCR